MQPANRRHAILWILVLLLAASLVANVLLYRKANRPLFDEGERPLVERTVAGAGARSPHRSAATGESSTRSRRSFPTAAAPRALSARRDARGLSWPSGFRRGRAKSWFFPFRDRR